MDHAIRFLRLPRVRELTGYSKTSLYRLIQARRFPAPVKLAGEYGASAWIASEVEGWMRDRITASRAASNPAAARAMAQEAAR